MKLLTTPDRGLGLVSRNNRAVNNLPSVPEDLMPPLTSLDSYTHLVDIYIYTHTHKINKPYLSSTPASCEDF